MNTSLFLALNTDLISIAVSNVRPKSVGYVELRSADPLVPPKIQPNYLKDPKDIKVLKDGDRWVYRMAQTNSFAGFGSQAFSQLTPGCESYYSLVNDTKYANMLVPNDNYLECVVRRMTNTGDHLFSTCKMGSPKSSLSVVNPRFQVLGGVRGLRVADASVMPMIINSHTCAPTVMMGERAAQFIKDDYMFN